MTRLGVFFLFLNENNLWVQIRNEAFLMSIQNMFRGEIKYQHFFVDGGDGLVFYVPFLFKSNRDNGRVIMKGSVQ